MRGKHGGRASRRLRLVGVPIAVLAVLALSESSIEPVRYPAVTGERVLESITEDALQRSDAIQLTTTAVGLTWPHGGSGDAAIRVSDDGASWGPWVPVHPDDHGPDLGSGEGEQTVASEAVYTGGASWLQVQWEGSSAPELQFVDTTGSALSVIDRASAQLGRIGWLSDVQVLASPDQPPIQPRSAWGGQDCVTEDVEYSTRTRVEVLFVHHTIHSANANGYRPSDVPELLYAICSYHVGVRGWHDIGYNTLIDSSGTIWEGRGVVSTNRFAGPTPLGSTRRRWVWRSSGITTSHRRPRPPRTHSSPTALGASTSPMSILDRPRSLCPGTHPPTPTVSLFPCGRYRVTGMSGRPAARGTSDTT